MNANGKCLECKHEPDWTKYVPSLVEGGGAFSICRRLPRDTEQQRFVNSEAIPVKCTCFRKKPA